MLLCLFYITDLLFIAPIIIGFKICFITEVVMGPMIFISSLISLLIFFIFLLFSIVFLVIFIYTF